jgi:type II secretory pathway component PulJ
MKTAKPSFSPRFQALAAMTLVELMVAISLAGIVLTVIMMLYIFGLRSFASMGNYAELNSQSRLALDEMSREIRQATQVLDVQANGSTRWILLANTNAAPALTNKYTWDSATSTMTWDQWQNGVQTQKTNLTGCDGWVFEMYTRAPDTNGVFTSTKDKSLCKLINMSWKCTRTILGKKLNTEAVLTAQIVLRNKQ